MSLRDVERMPRMPLSHYDDADVMLMITPLMPR